MRRRRWPVLLLLASGLTFLTSLYLPWQQRHLPDTLGAGQNNPLHVFGADGQSIDGWGEFGFDFGFAAAVFALALVVASVGALAGRRVPLARCALLVAYGAAAVAIDTWYARDYAQVAFHSGEFRLGYGAYVGLAAGGCALLGAASVRPRLSLAGLPAALVLVALALPWARFAPVHVAVPGYYIEASAVAAVAVFWAPAAAVLFCAATVATLGVMPGSDLAYGAWIGLAFAIVLAVVSVRPRRLDFLLAAPAAVFVATLYFKWQAWITGWTLVGTTAAMLALALVVTTPRLEVAAAFALMAVTQGFALTTSLPPAYHVEVAAYLGLTFAGLLVVAVVYRVRHLRPPRDRIAFRIAAAGASAACVAVLLVPTWDVLPIGWNLELSFAPRSWLGIVSVLLAVQLTGVWLRARVDGFSALGIPLVLLAIVALVLIRARDYHLTSGGWLVVGLSALLALLGLLEQRGRLGDFRLPEVLRVDRL